MNSEMFIDKINYYEQYIKIINLKIDIINLKIFLITYLEVRMNKRLKQCPVCNSNLEIVEYHCPNCNTGIKGRFGVDDFAALTATQQEFVKTFICCQGNIKEVEKILKISYPTVKNKLAEVTSILCDAKATQMSVLSEDVLEEIESGEITVEEALAKLRKRRQ